MNNYIGLITTCDVEDLNYCHLDSTFFHLSPLTKYKKMIKSVSDDFKFSVQAHKNLTHYNVLSNFTFGDKVNSRGASSIFIEKFKEILDCFGNKLAFVLFTFPYSFDFNTKNKLYIKKLKEYFEFNLSMEFRNTSWHSKEGYDFLSNLNIDFVNCDEPDVNNTLQNNLVLTGNNFILKFHGKNDSEWNKEQMIKTKEDYNLDKFDYNYEMDELLNIKKKILIKISDSNKTNHYYLFCNKKNNNHINNALSFKKLLGQSILL